MKLHIVLFNCLLASSYSLPGSTLDSQSPGPTLNTEKDEAGEVKILSRAEVLLMETILGRRENDEGLLTRDEVVNLERTLKSIYSVLF